MQEVENTRPTSAMTVFTGALKRLSGGGCSHFLYSGGKLISVRCPRTEVMVTEDDPHGAPKSKVKQ